MTLSVPSQQLRPAYPSATVATGVNLDVTGFVSPLFSRTAVEGSASQVVDPLPPAEEFALSVFYQVHQEQSAAGEMTENTIANFPVVQEQVIIQAILRVVGSLPPGEVFAAPVYHQVHHEQFAAGATTRNQRNSLLCRNRCSFRQFLVSLVHFLLLKTLLRTSRGGHQLLSRCGRLFEHSGMSWSNSQTLLPWSRFWTVLSRRWWHSCSRSSGFWTRSCRMSRLSPCPQISCSSVSFAFSSS